MPPKKKEDKNAEDFSDAATLPPFNGAVFTLLWGDFQGAESREKVQKFCQENWPAGDKVRTLTREDIMAYGKAKQIMLEPAELAKIPEDDPRHKMTDLEKMAKACSQRLFEFGVYFRRAKKERFAKLEEEAKAKATEDNPAPEIQVNQDDLDGLIQLVDYPKTKEEALALSNAGSALNVVLKVNQREPTEQELEEGVAPQNQEEDQAKIDAEIAYLQAQDAQEVNLREALRASVSGSAIRNQAFFHIEYDFLPQIHVKVNEETQEEEEERTEPEAIFSKKLYKSLERHGSQFVLYEKFKSRTQIQPLMPDKTSACQIQEILEELASLNELKQDAEKALETEEQKAAAEGASEEEQKEFNDLKEQNINLLKEQIEQLSQQIEAQTTQKEGLLPRLKVSLDEERLNEPFDTDIYKESFLKKDEQKNQIGSLISAMVEQISEENEHLRVNKKTETQIRDQELDSLFDSFSTNALSEIRTVEKTLGNPEETFTAAIPQDSMSQLHQESIANLSVPGQGNVDRGLTNCSSIGGVEYIDELDRAKHIVQQLSKETYTNQERIARKIAYRERQAYKNLNIPGGLMRNDMPNVPEKSQRLRDFENPQAYPFCTLAVEEFERGIQATEFQELLKQNNVNDSNNSNMRERHLKTKVFERRFQQFLPLEVLPQVFGEALRQEPDVATRYVQRDDTLLVALYQKENHGREIDQIDGEKQWQAPYRVLPDFQNWVENFADQVIQENDLQLTVTSQQQNTEKTEYQLVDELVPKNMIQIDDAKVGAIKEESKLFYPDDNSIMKVDHWQLGGISSKKSVIYKDNLTFGLRQVDLDEFKPREQEFGLVSLKPAGKEELWLQFENDTRMTQQFTILERNQQKEKIPPPPPEPTAEEIAAQEAAAKAAAAAAKKKGGKKGAEPVPVVEEKKEEPVIEYEEPSYLDGLWEDEQISTFQGTTSTITLKNGLIVQLLPSGEVLQTSQKQTLGDSKKEEIDRVITGKGTVIRHLKNKDIEILYSNGNRSFFEREEHLWTFINAKGMRRCRKNGIEWDIEPVHASQETDAVSYACMHVREDGVVSIKFVDGSFYTQHADGTQFLTNKEGNQITIEKVGLAPVIVDVKPQEENYHPTPSDIKPIDRSATGIVLNTLLPDRTVIQSFKENINERQRAIHILNRPDLSCITIDCSDETRIVSANSRIQLNEAKGKAAIGKDIDYLSGLLNPGSIEPCVYYAKVQKETSDTYVYVHDHHLANRYFLTGEIDLYKQILFELPPKSPTAKGGDKSLNQDDSFASSIEKTAPPAKKGKGKVVEEPPKEPEIPPEIEEIGGYVEPLTKNFLYPRLFVLNPDGTGFEWLTKEQLDYYKRTQKHKDEALTQRKVAVVGSKAAKFFMYLTKWRSLKENEQLQSQLMHLDFPQNAVFAIKRINEEDEDLEQFDQTDGRMKPLPEQFMLRQVFEFPDYEPFKQEAFFDDWKRFKEWKATQERYETQLGIIHVPAKGQELDISAIEDEEYFSERTLKKIIKERINKRPAFKPEEFKTQHLIQLEKSDEMSEFTKKMTTMFEHEDSWRTGTVGNEASQKPKVSVTIQGDNLKEEQNRAKKKQKAQSKLKDHLDLVCGMLSTPDFLPNYFKSHEGATFIRNNPIKPPSQDVLMRMSQRISRSQHSQADGKASNYEGTSSKGQSPSGQPKSLNNFEDAHQDQDNPVVALEPEDKMGSAFLGSKRGSQLATQNGSTANQASLYLREKAMLQQREQEGLLKAEEYHVVKTKDFNVLGRLREEKPFVKSTQKGHAPTELNEKFITTECITDRRVKISSMAGRQYINAPSTEQVRKQGQHQMILSAIEKKQTFADLINQANAMVTSVLHDPLKRGLNVLPSECKFGPLRAGSTYEMLLSIKNEDHIPQRIIIKPIQHDNIVIKQLDYGPIAPGMLKKVNIIIGPRKITKEEKEKIKNKELLEEQIQDMREEEKVVINEVLQVCAKNDVYKVPIVAEILPLQEFAEKEREMQTIQNRSLGNSRVKQAVQQQRMKLMDRFRAEEHRRQNPGDGLDMEERSQEGRPAWGETTNSDVKLPKIPSIGGREIDHVDPTKSLGEALGKGQNKH